MNASLDLKILGQAIASGYSQNHYDEFQKRYCRTQSSQVNEHDAESLLASFLPRGATDAWKECITRGGLKRIVYNQYEKTFVFKMMWENIADIGTVTLTKVKVAGAHCDDPVFTEGADITAGWQSELCTRNNNREGVVITINAKRKGSKNGNITTIEPIFLPSLDKIAMLDLVPPCARKNDKGECIECVWKTDDLAPLGKYVAPAGGGRATPILFTCRGMGKGANFAARFDGPIKIDGINPVHYGTDIALGMRTGEENCNRPVHCQDRKSADRAPEWQKFSITDTGKMDASGNAQVRLWMDICQYAGSKGACSPDSGSILTIEQVDEK